MEQRWWNRDGGTVEQSWWMSEIDMVEWSNSDGGKVDQLNSDGPLFHRHCFTVSLFHHH